MPVFRDGRQASPSAGRLRSGVAPRVGRGGAAVRPMPTAEIVLIPVLLALKQENDQRF